MTDCPLDDEEIRAIIEGLPSLFTTLSFIAACPYSGGQKSGQQCAVVHRRGSRSVCGRRLGDYQRFHQGDLEKYSSSSPARWEKCGTSWAAAKAQAPEPEPSPGLSQPTVRPKHTSALDRRMRPGQIEWKRQVAGIAEEGTYEGNPKGYLFPRKLWLHNLLPHYRDAVLHHVESNGISLHQLVHHVMSSQAFAFNLVAPFLEDPQRLTPVLARLLPSDLAPRLKEVERVEVEVDGTTNYFREPGARGENRTSADIGIWWRSCGGDRNLVLIEVKFTESQFGCCALGGKTGPPCTTHGPRILSDAGASCPLSARGRTYWQLIGQLKLFRRGAFAGLECCPFLHDGYQLMRNQLLAAAMEADPRQGLNRVDFAVLLHDENSEIRRSVVPLGEEDDLLADWPALLTNLDRFHSWPASAWIDAAGADPALSDWAAELRRRYIPEETAQEPYGDYAGPPAASLSGPVRSEHEHTVAWMGTPQFLSIFRAFTEVIGTDMLYFRPTAAGVIVIALHDAAPGYVGLRTSHHDEGYKLLVGAPVPSTAEVEARWRAFEEWLPTVQRVSREEQGVIPWIRAALRQQLYVPGLEEGWVFLHQEWRFLDDKERGKRIRKGKKSDVLMVHLPTGRLGIVEFKESPGDEGKAKSQLRDYARFWDRDKAALAPFFTRLLQTMGRLYGNAEAANGQVTTEPAALFFGVVTEGSVNVVPICPY